MYMCCGSSLTGDLPSAVWPAGLAACVGPDLYALITLCFIFGFSTFSSLSPFNCEVKTKIVMEICDENSKYSQKQVKGL